MGDIITLPHAPKQTKPQSKSATDGQGSRLENAAYRSIPNLCSVFQIIWHTDICYIGPCDMKVTAEEFWQFVSASYCRLWPLQGKSLELLFKMQRFFKPSFTQEIFTGHSSLLDTELDRSWGSDSSKQKWFWPSGKRCSNGTNRQKQPDKNK